MANQTLSVAQKKLNGTYRKDRHGKQEQTEQKLSETCFSPETTLTPPKEITDPFVKDYYLFHTNQLIQLKILSPSDIPEINLLYFQLQQLRQIQKQLLETDLTKDFDQYERLTKLSIKLGNSFSELAKRYYISPTARTRIQLDNLELETKKAENQSVISKLLSRNN